MDYFSILWTRQFDLWCGNFPIPVPCGGRNCPLTLNTESCFINFRIWIVLIIISCTSE